MEKYFDDNAVEKAMQVAQTAAGKQLMEQLQKTDPQAIQKAMAQAAAGDFSKISSTLAPLLQSEEIQKFLKQLGG